MRPVSSMLMEPLQVQKVTKKVKVPHILAKEVSVAPLDKRLKINAIPNSIGDHSTKIHSISEEMT